MYCLQYIKCITEFCALLIFVKFTKLFNKHSLLDIHGIMSIIYKQVIEVNIEANNA